MRHFYLTLALLPGIILAAACHRTDPYPLPEGLPIQDTTVLRICREHFDWNGDGVFTPEEAAAVNDISTWFRGTGIQTFKELQYFTGLDRIPADAFSGCRRLQEIVLPESIVIISDRAFMRCIQLSSVNIPSRVRKIKDSSFTECYALPEVILPSSLESIGPYAFFECERMKTLRIPASVLSLGEDFMDFGLEDLYLEPHSVVPASFTPFYASFLRKNLRIHVPASLLDQYKADSQWRIFADRMVGDL